MIPQGQQAEPDRADRHTVDPFATLPHEPGEKGDAQGRATVHPSALTRAGGHTGRGAARGRRRAGGGRSNPEAGTGRT